MFDNWDLLSFLAGLVSGGVVATFISVSVHKRMTASHGGSTIDQSKARAGGDIIGGSKR
jgi:hypothetical protein